MPSTLLVFASVALGIVNSLRGIMPTEAGALELRVRALYALNRHYQTLMGLDPSWTRGHRVYQLVHRELDPLMDRVREALALTTDERAQFVASRERGTEAASARSNRLLDEERANARVLEMRTPRTGRDESATPTSTGPPSSPAPTTGATSTPTGLGDILSTWMIAPVILLFLLWDTGDIKRGLLRAVPNRLFEPALAVLADVDQALGNYVRGIFLECCSLGLTVIVFITIVGVPPRWAIAIGIFTGVSNVIPYMGFAAALLGAVERCGHELVLSARSPQYYIDTARLRLTVSSGVVGQIPATATLSQARQKNKSGIGPHSSSCWDE